VVADVDELSRRFPTVDDFRRPDAVPRNSIFGTGWAIAKTSRPFNERNRNAGCTLNSLVGKTACFPRQLSAILGKACRNPDVPRPPEMWSAEAMSDPGEDPFDWVGATLDGKYQVDAVVGRGGFGVVYRAHHLGFNEKSRSSACAPRKR